MATLNLADVVVTTFAKGLDVFAHILTRAKEDAEEKGTDVDSLVQARIVEDQNPLVFQVTMVSQVVRNNLGRLAGEEPTALKDEPKTFADLQKHIEDTREILKAFDADKAKGREDTEGKGVPLGKKDYLGGFLGK
ncbi:hypothetical protein LQW54_005282 [Pestalotiopsis sp. IQ-011]